MHVKSIDVTIAGRAYPLKVAEEEEAIVAEAVQEINRKVRDYQNAYRNKDKQDCLSMALLTYAVEYMKLKGHDDVLDQITSRTQEIRQALDEIA